METFFPEDSPLRYWLCNATVSQIACTVSWPPVIAVIGYAPCVRAWAPTSRDEPEFKPVHQLLEVDGERFVAVTVKADILVAADGSISGRISIWDTVSWTRQQTLTAGSPVTSLDASRTYIAAGTAAGYVRVWKRQSASDATFTQFFAPDLQLDTLPVTTVRLGPLRLPGPGGSAGGGGSGGGGGGGGGGVSGSGGGGGGGVGVGGGGGGDGGGADAMMVVHTRGNGRVSAWRLSDAKIIGTLGRGGAPDSPEALLSANVVHACLARDTLLTCSWMAGRDPLLQWISPVQRAAGEVPGIAPLLEGLARPLCCDYDGNCIVLGCEDGTVWVWGVLQSSGPQGAASSSSPSPSQHQHQHHQQQPPNQPEVGHWRGFHRGSVGAVACLPHRGGQVASAGADGCVKLWSPGGQLVAVARLGWQPTTLAVNELALVVGGAAGQIQILVLLPDEQAATAASRPTEAERGEAQTPATRGSVEEYAYWFDARSPKAAAAASSGSGGGAAAGLWGLVSEHPDAFAAFVPPRRPVTVADLQQQKGAGGPSASGAAAAAAAATAAGEVSGSGAAPTPARDGTASGGSSNNISNGTAAAAGSSGGSSKASSFNMQAALKGAQRSAVDQAASLAAEEEAKRAQLRAMGEGPEVARSRGAVQLESATAAMGRKCANPSCLQREGLVALQQQQQQPAGLAAGGGGFKRCGACKSAFYCSAHCQSTHWRDGHKKECPLLAEAWRRQQEEQQQQQYTSGDAASTESGAPVEDVASGSEVRGGLSSPTCQAMGTSNSSSSGTQAPTVAGSSTGRVGGGAPSASGGDLASGAGSGAPAADRWSLGAAAGDCLNELD